jgi:hypothetical protein
MHYLLILENSKSYIKTYMVWQNAERLLRESVCRKRPEKWRNGDWILHHDNTPAHISHLVQQGLAKHGNTQL